MVIPIKRGQRRLGLRLPPPTHLLIIDGHKLTHQECEKIIEAWRRRVSEWRAMPIMTLSHDGEPSLSVHVKR